MKNRQIDWLMDGWMNGQIGWIDGCRDKWKYKQRKNRCTNRKKD